MAPILVAEAGRDGTRAGPRLRTPSEVPPKGNSPAGREVAEEIRSIAREQARWIKIASAFPISPSAPNKRGIDKTDWIRIDRATYDACLDRRDYRRGEPPPPPGGR